MNSTAKTDRLTRAAAPDLAAGLAAILHGQPEEGTITVTIGWLTHQALRAALAKARGEERSAP